MRCPICKRGNAAKRWEVTHRRTWTGEYVCPKCGPMRMSGHLKQHAGFETRSLVCFIPECSSCGLDPVVLVEDWREGGRYQCMICGERIEVNGRRVVRGRSWKSPAKTREELPSVMMWDGMTEGAVHA